MILDNTQYLALLDAINTGCYALVGILLAVIVAVAWKG